MKCDGPRPDFLRLRFCAKRLAGLLLVLISTSAVISFAAVPGAAKADPGAAKADEVRKLIKQAGKLTRSGSLVDAEKLLRRAIEIEPRRSETQVELAHVLVKQRRLMEAYDLSFAVAKAEPGNAHTFSVLGAALLTAGRFPEARLVLLNALKLDKKDDVAWAAFGLLDFYENHIDESIRNLQEAIFREPEEPDYYFALGQVSARAEKYQEAAEAFTRFLGMTDNAEDDRRARIKGLIEFLRFLGQKEHLYLLSGSEQTSVNIELVGNRPIIKMRINNREEPLRFVLDTGSGMTVISDKTAKRLNLKPITKGGHAKGIGGNGQFELVYGFLRDVAIGEVKVRNVPVYIRRFHNDAQEVDGYIGLSLISKFLATIDYGSKTFSLTRKEADTREFREDNDRSQPLRLTSSGFLSGEVKLEGLDSSLNFIVDTGASISVISNRVPNMKGISLLPNDETFRVVGSAGVTDDMPTYVLPSVTFGVHSRRKIVAVALDLDMINEASGFEQAGILGGNFLRNYRLTFDFKRAKVIFTSITPQQ